MKRFKNEYFVFRTPGWSNETETRYLTVIKAKDVHKVYGHAICRVIVKCSDYELRELQEVLQRANLRFRVKGRFIHFVASAKLLEVLK